MTDDEIRAQHRQRDEAEALIGAGSVEKWFWEVGDGITQWAPASGPTHARRLAGIGGHIRCIEARIIVETDSIAKVES